MLGWLVECSNNYKDRIYGEIVWQDSTGCFETILNAKADFGHNIKMLLFILVMFRKKCGFKSFLYFTVSSFPEIVWNHALNQCICLGILIFL